jgi:peptidoglycan/LPS O-acetylase OafA/YrhL
MTSPAKSRYGFIDAIRGLAACAVMAQHSLYQSGLLGGPASAHLTGFIPNWLELGETGVVAFFIVSGFVIPLSLEKSTSFKVFWIHRALRIYPLYLVIFFATFVLRHGGDIHSIGAFFVNFASHLFFIQEYVGQEGFVGGSWTLSLEMIWYAIISTLFVLSLNKKTVALVIVSLAISGIAEVMCAAGHHLPMGRLSMLLCCVLGLVCYRREQTSISTRTFTILSVLLGGAIVSNLFIGFQLFPGPHPSATFRMAFFSWSLAAMVFLLPFLSRKCTFWGHSGFSFLGRISYSVYLVHPIILYVLLPTHLAGFPLIAATFATTICMATLTYRFVESPPIRIGHRLKSGASLGASPASTGDGSPPSPILAKPAVL